MTATVPEQARRRLDVREVLRRANTLSRGQELSLLAGVWAATTVWVWLRLDQGWVAHDDGAFAESALRVLDGQLPHREFAELYTGAMTFLNAGTFLVLGEDLFSLRLPLFVLPWIRSQRVLHRTTVRCTDPCSIDGCCGRHLGVSGLSKRSCPIVVSPLVFCVWDHSPRAVEGDPFVPMALGCGGVRGSGNRLQDRRTLLRCGGRLLPVVQFDKRTNRLSRFQRLTARPDSIPSAVGVTFAALIVMAVPQVQIRCAGDRESRHSNRGPLHQRPRLAVADERPCSENRDTDAPHIHLLHRSRTPRRSARDSRHLGRSCW